MMPHKLQRIWLRHQIKKKWERDSASLPLQKAHREIYGRIHRFFWSRFNDFPDLLNCRDFNDRIQWLKLFDQRPEQIACVDKIEVRKVIEQKIGKGYTPRLLQVSTSLDDFDFASLPDKFVLKATNDSGTGVLVHNKADFDRSIHATKIERSLKCPWGWDGGEWAYSYLKPRVFAEEMLPCDPKHAPSDYKFHCVNGEVRFMHFVFDNEGVLSEQAIDIDGRDMGLPLKSHWPYGSNFERPDNWNELKRIAETLSRGWKYVRIDLYSIVGKITVGEMTFWPYAGFYCGKGQVPLGQMLDFDRTTFQPCLVTGRHSGFRNLPPAALMTGKYQ